MNFKDGLDYFGAKIEEVFLDGNLLFVAKNFLRAAQTVGIPSVSLCVSGS
jgi:hypothetical protein